MYTTNYSVTIKSISALEEPLELTGDAAQAAIAQMTSHRDVDVVRTQIGGGRKGIIFPYHDIDSAIIEETRTYSEYEDDNAKNCVVPDSGETGDFTITNERGTDFSNTIFASNALNGTYGVATFSTEEAEDICPAGYQSYTELTVSAGGSIVIEGLPVGTSLAYMIGSDIFVIGTAPGSYTFEGSDD